MGARVKRAVGGGAVVPSGAAAILGIDPGAKSGACVLSLGAPPWTAVVNDWRGREAAVARAIDAACGGRVVAAIEAHNHHGAWSRAAQTAVAEHVGRWIHACEARGVEVVRVDSRVWYTRVVGGSQKDPREARIATTRALAARVLGRDVTADEAAAWAIARYAEGTLALGRRPG